MKRPVTIKAARQTEILATAIVAVLPDGSRRAATIHPKAQFPRVVIAGFEAFQGIEYSWFALDLIAQKGEFRFDPSYS